MKSRQLFLASGNPHKIEELQQVLKPLGFDLSSTRDISNAFEVEEDRETLEGNALKKARSWFEETGILTMADDTGLEVEELDGEPGVYSARYAGENATYDENVEKLLNEMKGVENRHARFRTVIALVSESGEQLFEGSCSGQIINERCGNKGFGYDPVFKPDGYDKTFAELDSEEKNKISHRGKATARLIEFLKK